MDTDAYYGIGIMEVLQKEHLFVALVLPSPESHFCSGAFSSASGLIIDIFMH